jgi:hypothetical protein|tara:strand:- start:312 stop:983 length:672 start_codon:yes stop_codon:yes gene_type:complete
MATSYSPKIITDGLVLCLDAGDGKSYSGSGTAWTDRSSTNQNFTLTNGPTFNSGDQSILFDTTDDYATATNDAFQFGTGDFSIEVWIKPTEFGSYTHMVAFNDQSVGALKANVSNGIIYFYGGSGTYSTYGSITNWTLVQNEWNHVIFKRESSVGYGYLNGSSASGTKTGLNKNFNSSVVNIHKGWGSEFTEAYFGLVRLYNKGLSDAEVLQNYNATKGRFGV